MTEQDPDRPAAEFRRDRREHGGSPEARAEIRRESDQGELGAEAERDPFPPSHYDS